MKKKHAYLLVALIIIILFALFLCSQFYFNSNENGTLIICGKVVNSILIESDTSNQNLAIPVIETLRELGYIITYDSEEIITIIGNNHIYKVNLDELALYESGRENFNYLQTPPGAYYSRCYRSGMDIIIDVTTLRSALSLMESGYKILDIPKRKVIFIY